MEKEWSKKVKYFKILNIHRRLITNYHLWPLLHSLWFPFIYFAVLYNKLLPTRHINSSSQQRPKLSHRWILGSKGTVYHLPFVNYLLLNCRLDFKLTFVRGMCNGEGSYFHLLHSCKDVIEYLWKHKKTFTLNPLMESRANICRT